MRSALAQVSVDLVSLQHQISVQDRRAKWRRQKNATDLLNRVTRRPWTIAAVLSCLSQRTSRETPRMYVLWTLLRQRVRDRDGCIGDISEEGIDERIEDILSGAESVEIEAMVLDPNSRFHFWQRNGGPSSRLICGSLNATKRARAHQVAICLDGFKRSFPRHQRAMCTRISFVASKTPAGKRRNGLRHFENVGS